MTKNPGVKFNDDQLQHTEPLHDFDGPPVKPGFFVRLFGGGKKKTADVAPVPEDTGDGAAVNDGDTKSQGGSSKGKKKKRKKKKKSGKSKSKKGKRKGRFSFSRQMLDSDPEDADPPAGASGGGGDAAPSGDDAGAAAGGGGINMKFTYDLSAVTADHGKTDEELQANITTKVEQIQTCRTEVRMIKGKLEELQAEKKQKQADLIGLDDRQKELERQLARELDLRSVCTTNCDTTEKQLERARRKRQSLDMKDKYTFQVQQKIHQELSATLNGYSDAYSTVMCDKMKTLETACVTESHQKAKQAFSAASVKYKRLKTNRDQLSSEFRNLQEETAVETANITRECEEAAAQDQEKLQRYKDQLQRCLINRDLKYEAVLETKDMLVARIKQQMDNLHAGYHRLEAECQNCLRLFGDLIEQRKAKPFSTNTIKLVNVLPMESEYIAHLEKITKILAEYVLCMHEIDEKRDELLRQRATIMGLPVVEKRVANIPAEGHQN